MKISKRVNKLRIRTKLTLTYSLFFVTVFLVSSLLVYSQVRSIIMQRLESELDNTTSLILDLVKTSAHVSIKNHLRAIAKSNRYLIDNQYQRFQSGDISEMEAKSTAARLLLSQTVGKTGYLYIIDSNGTALVHPSETVVGKSYMDHGFIRDMVAEKEGYMEYMWQNPNEPEPQPKAQFVTYFEPWDWIIAATSYRYEFADLVNIDDFRDKVESLRFGESGYSMIMNSNGDALVHPFIDGNMIHNTDEFTRKVVETVISEKNGRIEYLWKNPGESTARQKIALFNYIPEYDWIVVSSVYMEDLFRSMTIFGNYFLVFNLILIVLIVLVSFKLGSTISRPVERLTDHLETCARENYRERIDVRGSAEVSLLSTGLNQFMDSLEVEIQNRKAAEESLRKNERKLLEIFNSSFHFIFLLDPDGKLREANQSALSFLGMEMDQLKGELFSRTPWWSASGEQHPTMDDAVRRCLEIGFARIELTNDSDPSKPIIFDISMKTIRDDTKRVAYVLTEARDITERVAAETALKKSEELHRAMLETSPNPVVLYDSDGNVLFTSPSFHRVFGWSFDELAGKRIDFVPEENMPETIKAIKTVYESQSHYYAFQTKRSTKSGNVLDVTISAATFSDKDGKQIGMVVNLTDITQIKQTESELRNTRNYIRSIINSMPSVLIGIDPEGRVTQWNTEAETLTGIPLEEALNKDVFALLPQLSDKMPGRGYSSVWKNARVQLNLGNRNLKADITVFPIASDHLGGSVIRIDDITQRIEMEEMMIQSDKMLSIGGLAAGMAHEINNPLAVILQSTQVMRNRLESGLPKNDRVAEESGIDMQNLAIYLDKRGISQMLESVLSSGKRAAEIVENMLSFARKSDSIDSSYRLDELMDNTIELARNDYNLEKRYDFRSIEIERQYQKGIPKVPCEKNKIQQVFLNILQNGAHAMAELSGESSGTYIPRFTIQMEADKEWLLIQIGDNGPGMDESVKKRVFEPFFTTKGVGTGTGLGLSVSYFIVVEHHNGQMSVESSPGNGTTFSIKLPLQQAGMS